MAAVPVWIWKPLKPLKVRELLRVRRLVVPPKVPPELTVTAEEEVGAEPVRRREPALMVVGPVWLRAELLVRVRVPAPDLVSEPPAAAPSVKVLA